MEYRHISPKYLKVRRLTQILGYGLFVIITGAIAAVGVVFGGWAYLATLPLLVVIADIIRVAIITPRQVRAIRYAETDDECIVEKGILFKEVRVVPYGRMQQVDIDQNPFLRHYGLKNVTLVTAAAAANVFIPGVEAEEADRLRQKFTKLGRAQMEGL